MKFNIAQLTVTISFKSVKSVRSKLSLEFSAVWNLSIHRDWDRYQERDWNRGRDRDGGRDKNGNNTSTCQYSPIETFTDWDFRERLRLLSPKTKQCQGHRLLWSRVSINLNYILTSSQYKSRHVSAVKNSMPILNSSSSLFAHEAKCYPWAFFCTVSK